MNEEMKKFVSEYGYWAMAVDGWLDAAEYGACGKEVAAMRDYVEAMLLEWSAAEGRPLLAMSSEAREIIYYACSQYLRRQLPRYTVFAWSRQLEKGLPFEQREYTGQCKGA